MREIEFRGWFPQAKGMAYEMEKDSDLADIIAENNTNINNNYILMQYTGLKDKNGKKIFEGDIVQYKVDKEIFTKGMVKYSEKYAQYVLVGTGNVKDEFEPLGDYNMKLFDVIRQYIRKR